MHRIRWARLLLLAILSSLLVAISRETRFIGIRGDGVRQNRGPPCPAAAASTQDDCNRWTAAQKIVAAVAEKAESTEKEAFLKQCPGYGYGGRIDKLFAEQVAPR